MREDEKSGAEADEWDVAVFKDDDHMTLGIVHVKMI